jgi:ATP-binding protein involved in chromosome partitioning
MCTKKESLTMITKEQQAQNNWRDKKIAENIEKIKHRILVFSGKGGVGKTTVSVNIAHGLQSHGYTTGILDADITGPNVPKMTGLTGNIHKHGGRVVSQTTNGVKVISMANILPPNEAVIWRGPMRSKMLYEFLGNVNF